MPETKYNSKIVFYGETLMDLTGDNVTADKLLAGTTAHDKTGAPVTGTCTFDADTKDATATAAEILTGKTAYKNGQKVTGTMPNKGAVAVKGAAQKVILQLTLRPIPAAEEVAEKDIMIVPVPAVKGLRAAAVSCVSACTKTTPLRTC
jgi:hypothetical protein